MGSKTIATVVAVFLYIYAQFRRRRDLIFHGQLRLVNAILIAITDRLFLFPLRRLLRTLADTTGLGYPYPPSYLSDFQDVQGKTFLTDILIRRSHLSTNQYVESVNVVPFNSGQMSNSARLELTYNEIQPTYTTSAASTA